MLRAAVDAAGDAAAGTLRRAASYVPAARTAAFMRGVGLGNLCKLRHADGAATVAAWRFILVLRPRIAAGRGARSGREVRLRQGDARAPGTVGGEEWRAANSRRADGWAGRCSRSACCRWCRRWAGAARCAGVVERSGVLIAQVDYSRRTGRGAARFRGCALQSAGGAPELSRLLPGLPAASRVRGGRPAMTPALAWRKLGLIEPDGTPTRRGMIFGFFNHGEGLAIAAALEQGGRGLSHRGR